MIHEGHTIRLTKKQINVLRSVAYQNDDRPHLQQVFFDVEQGYTAATDGQRAIVLAASDYVSLTSRAVTFGVAISVLKRIVGLLRGGELASFSLNAGAVRIEAGAVVLDQPLFDGEFPPLNRVLTPCCGEDDKGVAFFGMSPTYTATLAKIADALVTRPHKKEDWAPRALVSVPNDLWSPVRYDIDDPDTPGPARWSYWIMPMRFS